jgi:cysteine synthase
MLLSTTPASSKSSWEIEAVRALRAMQMRSGETPLLSLSLPKYLSAGIRLYLKDESVQPTGSLKHRLAASLFSDALCNRQLWLGRPVVEASSGSTAVSEAHYAKLLGLPFYAVMPLKTSEEKIALIKRLGGVCRFVECATHVHSRALEIANEINGHYMDQFTNAERVTDWRSNNIAESVLDQMREEPHPIPAWIVCGAGTGGTSATIGRFLRYRGVDTKVCVADPVGSAFKPFWESRNRGITARGSNIEGIGRPQVEPSFIPSVIDDVLSISDAESVAGMCVLSASIGRKVGPSSGTNFHAMVQLAEQMLQSGAQGSLVSILCDSGDRYLRSYHNEEWIDQRFGTTPQEATRALTNLLCFELSDNQEVN